MIIQTLPDLPKLFIYRLDLANHVTSRLIKDQPVHRWFYFPHSFSPQLVETLLKEWDIRPGSIIIDPFVGAGTTLRVAQSLGINGIGSDISPLSIFISNVKLQNYSPDTIQESLSAIQRDLRQSMDVDLSRPPRLQRAFTDAEYSELTRIRAIISTQPDPIRSLFFLALLRIQKQISRAIPDGGWFRWVKRPSSESLIWPAFKQFMNVMMQDIEKMPAVSGFWKIYQQDARRLETLQEHCHELSQGCQAVITSPPYPNRHDYSRVFQIELLTLGLQESDIFALRHNSLRSHVEARRPQDSLPVFILPRQLEIALEALLDKKIERRLQSMIIGYFEDMYAVLRSAYQILSFGGHMALVVGNVRHLGVMIPVDEVLISLAEAHGFTHRSTWVARLRGNSAQQMGRYGRDPARESIVLLQKNP